MKREDTMKITFVNHASVIFSHNDVNLITDPWLFGTAFNKGWSLVSKSKMQIKDFENITHIWFSHEHPDHFNMPVLKSIPIEIRKKIKVIFQDTLDHRIANKCRELGFKVLEMKKSKTYELATGFKVKCIPDPLFDSWLYAEINGTKILNLNDCVIDSHKKVKKVHKVTGDIDILLTQFGYANKVGNKEDFELRRKVGKKVLQRIKTQVEILRPKFIIPFASFVKFTHKDNTYMNDGMNQIDDVEKFIKRETNSNPIILYCGDEWSINPISTTSRTIEPRDNSMAINQYKNDFTQEIIPYLESPIVELDELKKVCTAYRKRLKKKNSWLLIRLLHKLSFFITAKIYLKDLGIPITFNLIDGIKESDFDIGDADIVTDSDSLDFVFKWDYGPNTLEVNGRYAYSGGNEKNFFRMFLVSALNNNGRTLTYLLRRIGAKINF